MYSNIYLRRENEELKKRNVELQSQLEHAMSKIQTLVFELEKTLVAPKQGENLPIPGQMTL